PLNIKRWVWHIVAIADESYLEVTLAHCVEPWSGRDYALCDLEPDLAPLVEYPGAIILVGLIHIAVQQLKTQTFGPSLLKEPPRRGPLFFDVGPISGDLLKFLFGCRQWGRRKSDAAYRVHNRDLGELGRAVPTVDRQGQRPTHPDIVEGLFPM